ncbi:MAG: aldehyde dehydrogenase family protein [Myxococcota bacterium]|nr:aldehyde dehydrogenase family protein [Myxococcota bacterium]
MSTDFVRQVVEDARHAFNSGKTRPYTWRIGQLRALHTMIEDNSDVILAALKADLGKPMFEAWAAEIGVALRDIKEVMSALKGWMKPEKVSTPLVTQPGSSRRYKDPLGVVLIIAPWNYPFNLVITPLIGAIAAGNAAVIKPSEISSNTSKMIADLLPRYVDNDAIKIVEGGVPETTALLVERFDHIFYTGNGHVARIIMAAAAKHLTPVTLELGGKSPVYINKTADLKTTARRVAWGKFTNAGQTCIAPDYVLIDHEIHDEFLARLAAAIHDFYGENPQQTPSYARIVSERHHQRLSRLLGSGEAVIGGQTDPADRYIAPTVLKNVVPEDPVMSEEIFGPILPVLSIDGAEAAIRFINGRDKPLALYIFTGDDAVAESILSRTSSGGATVNHVMLHYAVSSLPFGGVGESGMGAYHGQASFDTFTHTKSVLKKPFIVDPSIMYPPYNESKEKWLRRLL